MWSAHALVRRLASASAGAARRTFLSEAYRCTDAWNARLQAPILQSIKPESFYYELEGKFQQQGKCSPIDIDLFANRLTDGALADELADLLHKHRLTEETTGTLPSTEHALCRVYLEHVDIHELFAVLDNRLGYGVFLDAYTANLALDQLLRAREYTAAARIATFLMLQEDLDNAIGRALSLYACVKHLQAPQSFDRPAVASDETAVPDPAVVAEPVAENGKKPLPKKKKKAEEVRVRVKFLRNEYFDDHFDLREPAHLVGKTLVMIGRKLQEPLGNSAQLLGLWHYGKHAEAADFVRDLAPGERVHADVVKQVLQQAEQLADGGEDVGRLVEALRAINAERLIETDFEKDICALANESVQKYEAGDIEAQHKVYEEWISERQAKLDAEVVRLHRVQRLAEMERLQREMDKEEQRLWFFDNEDQIDLQIDSKRVFYPKRWFGKKKKPRVVDAGYVPPEIVRKTSKSL